MLSQGCLPSAARNGGASPRVSLLPQFPSALLRVQAAAGPATQPSSFLLEPHGAGEALGLGHRSSPTAPQPPSKLRAGSRGSRGSRRSRPPPGPALTQGQAAELAVLGPVGKAFSFSSSIKHFLSLEPQGGFGWEATWPWRCWPWDASRGGGMSPWLWAGSCPRSPHAAHRALPRPQQLLSHPVSAAGWPGGCCASVSPSSQRQRRTLGAGGVTPGSG